MGTVPGADAAEAFASGCGPVAEPHQQHPHVLHEICHRCSVFQRPDGNRENRQKPPPLAGSFRLPEGHFRAGNESRRSGPAGDEGGDEADCCISNNPCQRSAVKMARPGGQKKSTLEGWIFLFDLRLVQLGRNLVPDGLDQLDQGNQDDDGGNHGIGLEPLIPVADGQVPQAAAPQGTGHGAGTDQADHRQGDAQHNGMHGFRQQHLPDDLERGGPHALGGFNDPGIHFQQGGFDDPGNERGAGNGQRHDGGGGANGRPHDDPGEGNDGHHQDDEGHGPEGVDNGAQGLVESRIFLDVAFSGNGQDHPQGDAEQGCNGRREGHHVEGLSQGLNQQMDHIRRHNRSPRL